jgi:hypothetical protein
MHKDNPMKNLLKSDPDAFFQSVIEKRDAAAKARKKRIEKPEPVKTWPKNTPLWSPDDVDLNAIPPEVKQACEEIIQPF